MASAKAATASGFPVVMTVSGVSMAPGETALTRILSGPNSMANVIGEPPARRPRRRLG